MPSPLLHQPIPDFRRPTLSHGTVDTKVLRGHVVVVKFFARYCASCEQTLPALESWAKGHPDAVVLGVAEDERESDARELTASYGLSFRVIHDRGQVLAGRYRVRSLPATFVVSAAGEVQWFGGGTVSEADLDGALAAASR